MRDMIFKGVRTLIRHYGFDVVRHRADNEVPLPMDMDLDAAETIRQVRSRTMTSPERLFALIQAVRHVSTAAIAGDVVECGVWRGGSMMAAARTLLECEDVSRQLYLFDTFGGMSSPTDKDVAVDGQTALELMSTARKDDPTTALCYASIDDVKSGMLSTGYPAARMHFVKGNVEDSIPAYAPETIAILRLDTDWYESTRHEMAHLFPRLVRGGVLIVDDYGHWKGCRQAVDEYLEANGISLLLNRVDYTGRIAVKCA
jgi:O-methyltransferase